MKMSGYKKLLTHSAPGEGGYRQSAMLTVADLEQEYARYGSELPISADATTLWIAGIKWDSSTCTYLLPVVELLTPAGSAILADMVLKAARYLGIRPDALKLKASE